MTLFEHLSLFKRPTSEEDLTKAFQELAPHFIYGGYIAVDDAYQIYIRTIFMMKVMRKMQSKIL